MNKGRDEQTKKEKKEFKKEKTKRGRGACGRQMEVLSRGGTR